ncbi:MAG: D-alanyl-D-alanine carboxypeptidase, partial [Bacilli bacterium]|nr:D-alanyl-D-alanine carboxypeptidase [Bacilli bacterium]
VLIILFIPFNIYALSNDDISINSKNAIVINLNNNDIIYEKNKDEVINVASMQKIMTTIVGIENIDNEDESFVIPDGMFSSLDPELVKVGFESGDTVTYKDLLYGTMLRSGADAAYALAIRISGSEESYVSLMNDKASKLGLTNSYFKNTTGLDEDGQHSSVNDIAILFKYALNNKIFKEIVSSEKYTTSNGEYDILGPLVVAHKYDMNYFLGGKTGYTDLAGKCLASYGEQDGVKFLIVTANGNQSVDENINFLDHKVLYEYFINNYSFKTILHKEDIIETIYTTFDEEVNLTPEKDIKLYLNNDVDVDKIKVSYKGKNALEKDVKKGDKIGKYIVTYKGDVIYKEDALSPIDVKFRLKTIHKVIIGILVLLILYTFIKKKKRRRKKKYR